MSEQASNTTTGYVATFVDLVIVATAVASIVFGTMTALLVWEIAAVAYVVLGAVAVKYLTANDIDDNRVGALDALSWIFPLAASLAGANAAVIALLGRASSDTDAYAVAGMFGIPLSWLLLHVGFANIYASAYGRADGPPPLRFPGADDPGLVEFLYLGVTVGATFATSDVEIRARPMRVIVAIHCVISFFYNALVVAAAFQVLQQLAGG